MRRGLGVPIAAVLCLAVLAVLGIVVGSQQVPIGEVWGALTGDAAVPRETVVIVQEMRVPRTLLALLVGAALGLGGALMQALTRNPLADPGLLGVNAGAGLAVVAAASFLGVTTFTGSLVAAFLGASVVAVVVYAIGGRSGSAVLLTLTGVAVTAVLTGLANGIAIIDAATYNTMRNWMSGTVAGRELADIGWMLPFLAAGVVLSFALARPLGQIALGDELARSLGVRLGAVRGLTALAVTLLAGTATAAAGPIVFIGLIVPHLAKAAGARSQAAVCLLCALFGALILLAADIAGRLVLWPDEAPAGVLTAFLGAPVLIALVRRRRAAL